MLLVALVTPPLSADELPSRGVEATSEAGESSLGPACAHASMPPYVACVRCWRAGRESPVGESARASWGAYRGV